MYRLVGSTDHPVYPEIPQERDPIYFLSSAASLFPSLCSRSSRVHFQLPIRAAVPCGRLLQFRNICQISLDSRSLGSPLAKAWNRRRSGGTERTVRRIERPTRDRPKEERRGGAQDEQEERRRTKEKKKAVSGRTRERNGRVLDAEEPVGPWEVRCSR